MLAGGGTIVIESTGDGQAGPSLQTEPIVLRVVAVGILFALGTGLLLDEDRFRSALATNWRDILFWAVLIAIVNLLHYDRGGIQFTLDTPLLVATGLLYQPIVAAAIALIGALDVRELTGRVTVWRAIYNRAQVAFSLYVAAAIYHAISDSLIDWPEAILGVVATLTAFYGFNALFVALNVYIRERAAISTILRQFIVGRAAEFFSTYVGYNVLALVLARLFTTVGAWSVALFLVPLVAAYRAFVRAERMEQLARRLQDRERLLEVFSDRMVDERKDERLRIASDLHDDILQSLIRVGQLAYFLRQEAPPGTQAAEDAEELKRLSDETNQALRCVLGDLRRSPLGRGGLVRTLKQLVRDLQFESRIPIQLDIRGESELSPEVQVVLYQTAKEGLVNSLKHAHPSKVAVFLKTLPTLAELCIEDDGVGFDPTAVDETTHFGLGLLRERVEKSAGQLTVESAPEKGTRLRATIPLKGRHEASLPPASRASY
jgi:signal transduction histidine kinase